ncbi:hypothetical protein C8A03DRAFT_18142, partial [Achaetomium macrosporum]
MSNDEAVTVILRSPADWLDWHQEFRTRARRYDLTDYFDGLRELHQKPTAISFNPMEAIDQFRAVRYRYRYREEARNRNVSVPDGENVNFSTEVQHTQHNQIDAIAKTRSDEDYAAVKDHLIDSKKEEFRARERKYSEEMKVLDKLEKWLYKSVDQRYKSAHFRADQSLREWYEGLKTVAYKPHEIETELRTKMAIHLAKFQDRPSVKRDQYEQWIRDWETLFEKEVQVGMGETKSPT